MVWGFLAPLGEVAGTALEAAFFGMGVYGTNATLNSEDVDGSIASNNANDDSKMSIWNDYAGQSKQPGSPVGTISALSSASCSSLMCLLMLLLLAFA